MEYLVFRLYAPMASWGEAAVGQSRPSGLRPSRSALLGLIASALGISREQQEALDELSRLLRFGIKTCSAGQLVRDFHTAQVPSVNNKEQHRYTRRDELNRPNDALNTILSTREYRCDGYWVVAVWSEEPHQIGPYELSKIEAALLKPKFSLFLGRKACPLAAPLAPKRMMGDLQAALDTEFPSLFATEPDTDPDSSQAQWQREYEQQCLSISNTATYYWEGAIELISGSPKESHQLWDQPGNRSRWHFNTRTEHCVTKEVGNE